MKSKTTQRNIRSTFQRVIAIGYCNAQHLLNCREPFAYTCGNDGWYADVYDCGTTAIVTGYQPFGKKIDYDLVRKFETRATKICADTYDYMSRKWQLDELLEEFLTAVTT